MTELQNLTMLLIFTVTLVTAHWIQKHKVWLKTKALERAFGKQRLICLTLILQYDPDFNIYNNIACVFINVWLLFGFSFKSVAHSVAIKSQQEMTESNLQPLIMTESNP